MPGHSLAVKDTALRALRHEAQHDPAVYHPHRMPLLREKHGVGVTVNPKSVLQRQSPVLGPDCGEYHLVPDVRVGVYVRGTFRGDGVEDVDGAGEEGG